MHISVKHVLAIVLSGLPLLSFAGCGGGGSSGDGGTPSVAAPNQTVVSGTVQAPGGQVAFFKKPRLRDWFESNAYAALTGLANVPDNTIVQLARLNANASSFSVLSTATTSGGRYSFNLTALELQPANDLIVRVAGPSGREMRAFVVGTIADISPVSETGYQLAIQSLNGNPLSNLTLQEVGDISGAVALIAMLQDIGNATSVDQAVGLARTAVGANAQVTGFISAAAGAGQTTQGTGDLGNYFPVDSSNIWRYSSALNISGQSSRYFDHTVLVTGQEQDPIFGVNATVFADTNAEGENRTERSFEVKSPTGVVSYGNDDPNDTFTRRLTPLKAIHFPFTLGQSTVLGVKTGLDWGEDLDGDNRNEAFSLTVTQYVVGFESLTLGAGNFPQSLKIRQVSVFNIAATRGEFVDVVQTETSWYVSGVGLVKRHSIVEIPDAFQISTETEDLMAYIVSGQGSGARIQLGDGNLGPGSPLNLRLENTRQLFGALYDQSNRLIPDVPLSYASSNPQVATVDVQGLVTALSPGTTNITAQLGNITSNAVPVTVNDVRVVSLATKDLVYDPISQRIYASVPNRSSHHANTVTAINPVTGQIGPSISVGNDPGKLAISDNGQYLYVALNGEGRVQRVNLTTFTLGPSFALPAPGCGLFSKVGDMEVLPANPLLVAILRTHDCSPPGIAIEIYDNGVRRPAVVPTHTMAAIERTQQSNVLYGIEPGSFSHLVEMSINSDGVVIARQSAPVESYGTDLRYDSGLLFTNNMRVINTTTLSDVGLIQHPDLITSGMTVPNLARSRVFVIPDPGRQSVLGFDTATLQFVGSVQIAHNLDGGTFGTTANSLIGWGTDGLAYRTGYSPVYDSPNDHDLVVLIRTGSIQ